MRFNRIINDIIDWVRRLLYWKTNEIKKKPYRVIEIYKCKYGLLRIVERDTPRAVLTFIYTPKADAKTNVVKNMYDYHICLDHLWLVDNSELSVKSFQLTNKVSSFKHVTTTPAKHVHKRGEPTHTITIMRASRWLDTNGDYQTTVLYYDTFDFIGKDTTNFRDKYAFPILKDVIHKLKYLYFDELDWKTELAKSQRKYMGAYYLKTDDRSIQSKI